MKLLQNYLILNRDTSVENTYLLCLKVELKVASLVQIQRRSVMLFIV